MRFLITETDVNRLAQTFYEASDITLPSMTDKPKIVRGLTEVLRQLGIEVTQAQGVSKSLKVGLTR